MERRENEQNNSEMMIYTTEDGLTKIETTFDGDTVGFLSTRWRSCFSETNLPFPDISRTFSLRAN